MSDETTLIVTPSAKLDAVPVSDDAIVEINHAYEDLYSEQRQEVSRLLRQLPSIAHLARQLVEGQTYQAVISSDVLRQIGEGSAEWDRRKSGFLGPTIRDTETGKIIGQVELEEMQPELLASLNQLAVQRSLAEIVQQLEAIDQKVTNVLAGQRNDRLALIEGGVQLYLQAMAASRPETRHQLLIEAVDKLTVGRQQLILSTEAGIRSLDEVLPRSTWQLRWRSLTRNVAKQIEAMARPVQESFQAVLRSSYVLACAYQALDELDSLVVSLQPLREVVLKIGAQGAEMARWLPYDSEHPPEELWYGDMLKLADATVHADRHLEFTDVVTVEYTFKSEDLIGGAVD